MSKKTLSLDLRARCLCSGGWGCAEGLSSSDTRRNRILEHSVSRPSTVGSANVERVHTCERLSKEN